MAFKRRGVVTRGLFGGGGFVRGFRTVTESLWLNYDSVAVRCCAVVIKTDRMRWSNQLSEDQEELSPAFRT